MEIKRERQNLGERVEEMEEEKERVGEGREKEIPLVFFMPTGRAKQTERESSIGERDTLTVTGLDLWEFRALSARLMNTSFSFNGAGASPRAAFKSTLYLGHLALFLRAEPRGQRIQSTSHAASLCLPAGAPETGGKLIGLSGKNK